MKIELKLEVTPGTARRIGIVGATLLVLGTAAAVYANQITFTSGATLTAADLNNNFDELYGRGGNVVWKDATGAVLPVVEAQGVVAGGVSGSYVMLWMPDANGYLWRVEASTGKAVATVQSLSDYGGWLYTSAGCTGSPAHISASAFIANAPFPWTDGVTFYVIPNDAVATSVSGEFGGPSNCIGSANPVLAYPVSSLRQVTMPTQALFTPPAHAEYKP